MKINPIGIDSYQQMMGKRQAENRPAVDDRKQVEKSSAVSIPGQGEKVGSELSVRLKPGTFVDMLSTDEKQAMEMFFDKYKGVAPSEGIYSSDGKTENAHLGKQVDVKL